MQKNTGGLPVITPAPLKGVGQEYLTLMSDWHLGAANCDTGLIQKELQDALALSSRILLGGDIFDLILPGDRKRFTPDALHPRLQGRKDIINEVLDWAEELLGPVAELVDCIGCGNHETASEKVSGFDPIAELCRRLSSSGHRVYHSAYQAIINYRLPKAQRYLVWYHHGSGNVSKQYLALKKLTDQVQAFDADLYWSGHSHHKVNCVESRVILNKEGSLETRDVRCVVTGSYLHTYADQSPLSVTGRKSNYAADQALRPHGLGGACVCLEFDRPGYPSRVCVAE